MRDFLLSVFLRTEGRRTEGIVQTYPVLKGEPAPESRQSMPEEPDCRPAKLKILREMAEQHDGQDLHLNANPASSSDCNEDRNPVRKRISRLR